MGLIARELERRGIPTLSLSSARSITRSVNPPRAAFLDFPLGHTAGRPGEDALNQAILRAALAGFEQLEQPGEVLDLDFAWDEDEAWKQAAMRPSPEPAGATEDARLAGSSDARAPRRASPQYQAEADRLAAEAALSHDGCPGCVFLE